MKKKNYYDKNFFAINASCTLQSAKIIVPFLLKLLYPKSVVDVGCGTGVWLKEFVSHGINDYLGIDGGYLDQKLLLIDQSHFRAIDLSRTFEIEKKFDLALCLEVAEHIDKRDVDSFVQSLTRLSDQIVFSAAIPGQKYTGHINLQWPDYWEKKFKKHGFIMLDPIRKHIFNRMDIAWWYRQNTFLFISQKIYSQSKILQRFEKPGDIYLIHKSILNLS